MLPRNFLRACFPKYDAKPLYCTATFWVSAIQLVLFGLSFAVKPGTLLERPSENHMLGPPLCSLFILGAKWAPAVRFHFQVHRIVLPFLLHAGIFHIVVNLLIQFQLGLWIEDNMGIRRFLVLYIMAGMGGVFTSMIATPYSMSVGASGAVCGLLGVHCARVVILWGGPAQDPKCHCPHAHLRLESLRLAFVLACVLLLGFIAPNVIDNWVHVGGLVVGLLLGFAVLQPSPEDTALVGYARVSQEDLDLAADSRPATRQCCMGLHYRKVRELGGRK